MAFTLTGNSLATTDIAPTALHVEINYRREKLFACIDELFMINSPDKWIEMLADNLADLLSPDHWTGEDSALTKNEIFETVFMYQRLFILLPRLHRTYHEYRAQCLLAAQQQKGGEQ